MVEKLWDEFKLIIGVGFFLFCVILTILIAINSGYESKKGFEITGEIEESRYMVGLPFRDQAIHLSEDKYPYVFFMGVSIIL